MSIICYKGKINFILFLFPVEAIYSIIINKPKWMEIPAEG